MKRRRSRGWGRWLGVVVLVLIAGLFSFLNAGERVTISTGFTVLYRVSLVGLVFTVFLAGMVTMFLFGLRHDRRIRDALREQEYRPPSPQPYPYDPPPDPHE